MAGMPIKDGKSISTSKADKKANKCDTDSIWICQPKGCVYWGAGLFSIGTDAVHLVTGRSGVPVIPGNPGEASEWFDLYRNSFSTDLKEPMSIFGAKKAGRRLMNGGEKQSQWSCIFNCIVGFIGDDLEAVCKKGEKTNTISLSISGFVGTRRGVQGGCRAC